MIDLSNKIFLFGGFYPENSEKVVKGIIEKFESGIRDIFIFINSDGGYIDDLFAITDTIDKYSKEGLTVTTVAVGAAQSAGAFLLMYGNKRYAGKNTRIMVHGAQGGLFGDEETFKRYLKGMSAINDQFAGIIASKTGITESEARKLLKRDNFFTADEAVKYGLIDGVWDVDETVTELSKYIQDNLAAKSKPAAEMEGAMKFVASINTNKNEVKDMTERNFELELKSQEKLVSEYATKVTALMTENADLKKKIEDSEKYKLEFFTAQKERIIASAKVRISLDATKQEAFAAELKEFIDLPYDKFEKIALQMLNAKATPTPITGLAVDATEVDKKRAEFEKLPEPEKAISEYFAKSKKVDDTYAKSLMGGN